MWECTFNTMKRGNEVLRRFLEDSDRQSEVPLNPRDAFYGGRTNCTRLFYEAKREEKIRYLDVCSLYPYVCKYAKLPVGHPEVLVGKDCPQSLDGIDGVVKATMLPPQNLYHPVLPYRVNNRLLFPLCRSCAEDPNDEDCVHVEDMRHITGTWISDELDKAVNMGYKVVKIHEVWKYKTTQYNGRDGGLFKEYIDKFLKLKQEASGWPAWCQTDADKDKYILDFEQHEGIKLDKDKIQRNKGFRALAKMMLNSFWGKFGQRDNLTRTNFVNSREELTNLLDAPGVVVNGILPLGEDTLLANWGYENDAISSSSKASVVVAAYVTAAARLKLFSYLEMLGERVIYFDTDSIIFIDRPGMPTPTTGDYLGDLTDELEEYGEGSFIDCFVSGGPKNYTYRVNVKGGNTYKYVCKVKGINLNFSNSQKINFEQMRTMILTSTPNQVILRGKTIARTKEMAVITRPDQKTYRVVCCKRRRVQDYDTIPFGYKRPRVNV